MLEREAAALFAENATTADFDRLQQAHEAVLAAAATAVTAALIARAQATDDEMHAAIVDSLHNEIVSNAYRVNSIKIRLIRQEQTRLDATLVVPLPVNDAAASPDGDLDRFLREMSVTDPQPVPKLNVTISSLPAETTVVVMEQRGRT